MGEGVKVHREKGAIFCEEKDLAFTRISLISPGNRRGDVSNTLGILSNELGSAEVAFQGFKMG